MRRFSANRGTQYAVFTAFSLLLSVSMLACTIVEPVPTPAPTATTIPSLPQKVIVFCADETPSYPEAYFRPAVNKMADWYTLLIQPGQLGSLLYVRWINNNSYSDSAAALPPIEIPPIDPTPAPLTPLPAAPPLNGVARGTYAAQATQTESAVVSQNSKVNRELAKAAQALHDPLDALRHLPWRDIAPSDIWGCPQRASEIFQGEPATSVKYLVIASDMEVAGPQQLREVHLDGVHVAVVNYKCEDVNECTDKSDYWSRELKKAGIADIRFLRPDQTAATVQLFDV